MMRTESQDSGDKEAFLLRNEGHPCGLSADQGTCVHMEKSSDAQQWGYLQALLFPGKA